MAWCLRPRWWLSLLLGLILAWGLSHSRGLANSHQDQQITLPPLQTHPVPPTLQAWSKPLPTSPGPGTPTPDYFDQVKQTEVGYLIWSQFPIQVYIQPPDSPTAQAWIAAAQQAVQEWQAYLPLKLSSYPTTADITIQANRPSHRSGERVRSAETFYELYIDPQDHLAHRCQVIVRPTQAPKYVLAALRHELGHALGIWGHSPLNSDALYFAQVADPPPISARDIQTLIRIYQQPTRLGWSIPVSSRKIIEKTHQ
ncbi:peptidase [Thermosynechococcaceae cyanobacterium BACA0444]|uniref:Peptidase n=1 Tax=Pseudocalidococcus azoricus BACA0444 TaxID=2918990 RepID=A0AAE4FSE2_9CYAN|nr:peptidase [Pseudocalidococcus azoricus]MDS3860462.1 peptidase [Pseudocalidococcus azoricus BACA0444]